MSQYSNHEMCDDRDELADLDCDYGFEQWLFEAELYEFELDAAGTSHEPQREDYADVCWLATDEDRAEFEQWATRQGWIERAAA